MVSATKAIGTRRSRQGAPSHHATNTFLALFSKAHARSHAVFQKISCRSTQHPQPSVTDSQELVQLQCLLNSLVTICGLQSMPKLTTALGKVVTAVLRAEDFGG